MRSHSPPAETANDRFKRGFGSRFWLGLLAATLAHAALMALFPGVGIAPVLADNRGMTTLELPDIRLPEEPAAVPRPAAPVAGDRDVDIDITIPRTDLESNPPALLPPPPGPADRDLSAAPTFTPSTVSPRLDNPGEVVRLLERFYPPFLRDAGIGGTVRVWFFIDAEGRVQRTLIDESSGFDDLDAAALRVADRMRFTPAWNRDRRVPVWVSIPIVFEVRE